MPKIQILGGPLDGTELEVSDIQNQIVVLGSDGTLTILSICDQGHAHWDVVVEMILPDDNRVVKWATVWAQVFCEMAEFTKAVIHPSVCSGCGFVMSSSVCGVCVREQ